MTRILALTLTLAFALPAIAHAQLGGGIGGPGGGGLGGGGGGEDKKDKKKAPPDALPGAAVDKERIIPSDHAATDIPPTEALFDAINRGDIADARDAIARGADIDGRNVLGLTPLDESVDLGRNDITFLLLSLRSVDSPGRPPSGPTKAVKADAAEKKASKQAAKGEAKFNARAEAGPAVPRSAPLFAGNGGAPVPNAGFLGFDTRTQ